MIITAAGLLVRDNKILLGKRQSDREFYPGVWDMIGGRCEAGETPEKTLVRELQEEIGITPTGYKFLIALRDEQTPEEYEYRIYVVFEWVGTPENLQTHEHSEIAWLTIGEAKILNLAHSRYPELFVTALSLARD